MTVDVVLDLERAAALVAAGWTQGHEAVDIRNREVAPDDPDAVAWCLIGSLRRVAEADEHRMENMLNLVHAEMLRQDGLNELEYWSMREDGTRNHRVVVEELAEYNDDVDRDAFDVEELLRAAAEKERTRYGV